MRYQTAINNTINVDPEIMSGIPVFRGTRVPIKTLFDYLSEGSTLSDFFDDFPSVTHEQAMLVIELSRMSLLEQLRQA